MAEKTDAEILESLNLEPDTENTSSEESNSSQSIEDTQKELEELAGFGGADDTENNEEIDLEALTDSELTPVDEKKEDDPFSLDHEETPQNESQDSQTEQNEQTDETPQETQEAIQAEAEADVKESPEITTPIDEESFQVQKKQSMLRKILMGLIAFLVLVILVGAILYFMGFFDPEPPKPTPAQIKAQAEAAAAKIEEETKYKFKKDDINVDRLNKKLNLLTKYEIIESEEKEKMKDDEREKLYQMSKSEQDAERQKKLAKIQEQEELRMKEMIEAAKEQARAELLAEQLKQKEQEAMMQEEEAKEEVEEQMPTEEQPQEQQEENTQTEPTQEVVESKDQNETANAEEPRETQEVEEATPMVKEEIKEEPMIEEKPKMITFLKFISIETNKRDIFLNEDIKPIEMIDKNFKLCRDNRNNVEIIIGPFEEDENRQMILNEFGNNKINAVAVDYPQEEYDRRCNY